MKRDESVYLKHARDAVEKIELYLQGIDESSFKQQSMVQDAVVRQLEILARLSKESRRSCAGSIRKFNGRQLPG